MSHKLLTAITLTGAATALKGDLRSSRRPDLLREASPMREAIWRVATR